MNAVLIASSSQNRTSDISREGVQRDLLPIVEGSAVNTKYGMVRTDHILFIAAGAFHFSKPSDMIPELQGRFPLRVELNALGKDEFLRILTEPHNALTPAFRADADIHKLCFARDEPETAIACDKPVLFDHKVEAVLILHEVMMHRFPAPRIGKAEAADIINGRHILFLCFADQDFPCSFSHKTSASLRRM